MGSTVEAEEVGALGWGLGVGRIDGIDMVGRDATDSKATGSRLVKQLLEVKTPGVAATR